ncbi:GNAT family N-acetyltransferase [Mammaliicoccus lentus]|uniref:GNAT family N-acetyltransferase n=1 Tax=Mammaliicoccus lentus TaxID=42858 RepID=UPI001B32A7AC|nr:GNAT family N-acetyltransferase [Mammaliicoccus lentus]
MRGHSIIYGIITYIVHNNIEIISLNGFQENHSIGTKLLNKVEVLAQELQIKDIKIITTNDNINALTFYLKRGYYITNILKDAIAKFIKDSRKNKLTV